MNPGGTIEYGGLVPPYEGRKTSGEPEGTDESLRHPSTSSLPNQGTAATGDRQPASDVEVQKPGYKGTGPAHTWGTSRGSERVMGKSEEKRRKGRQEVGIRSSKPIDDDMPETPPG